jgi:hypothetical protein
MSKKVIIYDGVEHAGDLAAQLRTVADLIDQGYTSGHNPGWEIVEDEDEE